MITMTRDRRNELRQLPVFASLSKRTLSRLDSLMTPVRFATGNVLCHEGHVGREAFIIVSGSAVVSRGDETVAVVGPGALVGELALLGDGRRTASVTATESVEALVMSPLEFASVLALPGVDDEVRRVAAERTRTPAAA
jgi:CRP-like cAMP-binding protein